MNSMNQGKGLELFWLLMGRMALIIGLFMLIPFLTAMLRQEIEAWLFLAPAATAIILGLGMERLGANHSRQLTTRESAMFMVLVWVLLGALGAMPYIISGLFPSVIAAIFETIASLTTTGLSCLFFDRTTLPPALLLWHSLMSWLGGLSFVIMLATVMPQISGCFGLSLSVRQSIFFSPVWNRMSKSVRQGASVYAILTLLAAGLFWLAGLTPFEALTRAMMTLSSSGGVSIYTFLNENNVLLELAGMASMLFSSISLLLCWKAWNRKNWWLLLKDTEFRVFMVILLAFGAMLSLYLYLTGVYDLAASCRYGFFQALSFLSTNGYASAPFWQWPDFTRYLLFILVFIGGCMGSAAGGLKVMRILVLWRMAWAELKRTLHPHMVIAVKVDGLLVPAKILGRILTFLFLYMAIFVIFSLLLSLTGIDMMQAMGLAAGCLTSTGSTAALFGVGTLAYFPDWAKLLCCLLMILGRIEIFSFLVLLDVSHHIMIKRW